MRSSNAVAESDSIHPESRRRQRNREVVRQTEHHAPATPMALISLDTRPHRVPATGACPKLITSAKAIRQDQPSRPRVQRYQPLGSHRRLLACSDLGIPRPAPQPLRQRSQAGESAREIAPHSATNTDESPEPHGTATHEALALPEPAVMLLPSLCAKSRHRSK